MGTRDLLVMSGLDLRRFFRSIQGISTYLCDLRALKRQMGADADLFPLGKWYPCLCDRTSQSGSATGHYFHQDLLVARRIHANQPDVHVDVGSRVDGFVAHVAAFRPIQVVDIRRLSNTIPNVTYLQADFMAAIPDSLVACCDSLSCLHALEHFGLGRYGDPVNSRGHLLGLNNLHRALKKGGTLYLSVPIGPQRIEFNAHRVFSISYLLECLKGRFQIKQFSFVDDQGHLHENVLLTEEEAPSNFHCTYGCGIFELIKQ